MTVGPDPEDLHVDATDRFDGALVVCARSLDVLGLARWYVDVRGVETERSGDSGIYDSRIALWMPWGEADVLVEGEGVRLAEVEPASLYPACKCAVGGERG